MMSDTFTGKTIGKYEIQNKIGRGGMAEVYLGHQKNLDRPVAVKFMHAFLVAEQNFLNRFQREARAMAALNHPHIASIYDFDLYDDSNYYLVMEYIDGGTLKEKLEALSKKKERIPLKEAVRITKEVADALMYAHRLNMIHRDIKPGNIMLDKESGRAILTDFGIVKMLGGQTMAYTATGMLIGTPAYMSPEQAMGKSGDERSDLYSLGVLLFQMTTGSLPYEADTPIALVMKHVSDQIPAPVALNPEIDESLQRVILRALAKDPTERYQSAAEMAAALRGIDLVLPQRTAATSVLPTHAPTPAPPKVPSPDSPLSPPPPAPKARKHWPWAVLAIVAILLSAVVAAAVLLPRTGLIPGFDNRPSMPVAVGSPLASHTPIPTTAVPTNTPIPADTPDSVATILAAAALTATSQGSTAVPTKSETLIPTVTKTAIATNTQTATATPTIAPTTATATSSGNSTGTAHTGSGLPLSFESFGTWVRGDEEKGTFSQSSIQVHGGASAGKLSYDFDSDGNDYVVFLQLNNISGSPNALQVWVYGDGSGHFLNAWVLDNNGETWQVPLGRITHSGWKQMTGYIETDQAWPWGHISGPSNDIIDYPLTFRAFVLDDFNNNYSGKGVVYLDDLTTTTADVGSIPTAPPVTSTSPTVTSEAAPPPGELGRIIYTSGAILLTTDPSWSTPKELGSFVNDSCSNPATTVSGDSYNLYRGFFCHVGPTGTGVCQSPNGQYEVITDSVDDGHSIVVRPSGTEDSRFVYQGDFNNAEGIRWSPQSDSFLFVIDNSVHRAYLGGNYDQVIPSGINPIFSQDGSLILYRKPVGPGITDIFVSNADGSDQQNVTNVLTIEKKCAAWRN